jgi:hypothetical protein
MYWQARPCIVFTRVVHLQIAVLDPIRTGHFENSYAETRQLDT